MKTISYTYLLLLINSMYGIYIIIRYKRRGVLGFLIFSFVVALVYTFLSPPRPTQGLWLVMCIPVAFIHYYLLFFGFYVFKLIINEIRKLMT